ncbi:DUF2946 domain-containing protein [Acinetobacter sp. MD2(2019)]|nr:DUF2946 domain-containing protein [Acinetobacter sp. MD2(2019)]
MRQFGFTFGLLALLLQNLVFWQIAMPKTMQSNLVCAEISVALDQHSMSMSEHHMMMQDMQHDMSKMKTSSTHDDMLKHCHFCQLYHQLSPLTEINLDLIEIALLVRLILLATLAYVFFDLRRLFLCPQGRAPPLYA